MLENHIGADDIKGVIVEWLIRCGDFVDVHPQQTVFFASRRRRSCVNISCRRRIALSHAFGNQCAGPASEIQRAGRAEFLDLCEQVAVICTQSCHRDLPNPQVQESEAFNPFPGASRATADAPVSHIAICGMLIR